MTMPPGLNVVLVGCGRWGLNILRDLRSLGVRVPVVDPDPACRALALEQGAASASRSLELDDFDADGIVVASPATTHVEVLDRVLPLGVPVFAEKPLTTDAAAARRLAEAAPDRLFVMHNWRYHPGIEALAEIARSASLGPPLGLRTTRTNWTSPRTDVDAFFTLLPHDVSIALAVFGSIPTPRFAHAELVDDRAVSICAVLSGPHYLVIEAGNRYADKRREVRLHCRDGVAVLPHGEADWIEVATDDPDDPEHPRIERRSLPSDPPLRRELEVFVKHLGGGPPPKTTAAEGALVVETVAALRRMAGVES